MLIIERFESDTVIIEDGERHFEINRSELSEKSREGDVIVKCGSFYETDSEQTKIRREKIKKLQDSLWS
jgi:hypothetical protein